MIEMQFLQIVGGLGIFVYSLRIITSALDDTASEVIRVFIEKITSRSYYCVLIGIICPVIFQASSTVILLTMGLLNKSLLSLPQAALIALGAALGTTLKFWGYWDFSLISGTLFIFFSSIGILFNWHHSRARIFEISLGIGLTILGLQLITTGLTPLLESPLILQWIKICQGSTFLDALIAALCGILASVIVQSSSSVVIITIGFAVKGLIPFEGAAAIILGANIGTTSTALLLSVGQSISAKRLAFMHFAAKSIGVIITLLFFKTFLSLILFLLPNTHLISTQLALVHTGFNILDLLFWWVLLPILVRIGRAPFPDSYDSEYWLSVLGVQKLLAKMPERAIKEALIELEHLIRGLSELSKSSILLLTDTKLRFDLREETLKDILSDFKTYERRLKNLEQVLGRVASRFDGNYSLKKKLFFTLERLYKIDRIMSALKNLISIIDTRSIVSEINDQTEINNLIAELSQNIEELWNHIYSRLTEDSEAPESLAEIKGGFLYQHFFKDKNHRNGLKMQKIYTVILSLQQELNLSEENLPSQDCKNIRIV